MKPPPVDLAPVVDLLSRLVEEVHDHNQARRIAERDTPEIRAEIEALRRPLRRMGLLDYMRPGQVLLPLLASAPTIPESYWTAEEDGLAVACPCGEQAFLARRSAVLCDCGRGYVAVDDGIRVLFSPKPSQKMENQ